MPSAYKARTIIQASFFLAAVLVAVAAVLFDKIIAFCQGIYFDFFNAFPMWATFATPLLFVLATGAVVYLAPHARGSGIPQALKAMLMSFGSYSSAIKSGLISVKTAAVKVLSASIGIIAGASIGREGPTVQISTAIFAWIGSRVKKKFPHTDFHSYLVAGSATGVAAAFNTPLAGVTFAIEEMAEGSFAQIKQTVMVSVIIGGIVAQMLVGNYLYFGHPTLDIPGFSMIWSSILIGLIGGAAGGLFSRGVAHEFFGIFKHSKKLNWLTKALICGVVVAVINFLSSTHSAGSGYEITRTLMESSDSELSKALPLLTIGKIFTTLFSFLSGMAGGIFSPSLAIGAGLGASVAQAAEFLALDQVLGFTSIKTCALLGMVAFFTGVVQAPLTAVIIVMEMTDLHELILPLMLSGFIAQGVAKFLMPTSLYHYLAHLRQ